jgi:hypothetical protein
MARIATIECSTCSALLEIYPQTVPDEPNLGWSALDDGQLCKAPPCLHGFNRRYGAASQFFSLANRTNARAVAAGIRRRRSLVARRGLFAPSESELVKRKHYRAFFREPSSWRVWPMACKVEQRIRNPGRRASIRYPVLPLAAQRRSILKQLQPIEDAYARMHPEDPSEAEANDRIDALYREIEAIETKMAALTARSVDGLIEQMQVLKAHISVETPERGPLAEAVLRALRRLKQGKLAIKL